jgi:hypothetical protein
MEKQSLMKHTRGFFGLSTLVFEESPLLGAGSTGASSDVSFLAGD